jgi:hypothetical protein
MLSHSVLTNPDYDVPAVPDARAGVAWLRASVPRFSRGVTHERRRALAIEELAHIDPDTLRKDAGGPVEVLAEALGLPAGLDHDVELVAACYQPHVTITDEADQAVDRLVSACGGVPDEATANRIGLLVQACVATKALARNPDNPPVPVTRRVAPDGALVEVNLTEAPFGAGPHACPGRAHALAIVEGMVGRATPTT